MPSTPLNILLSHPRRHLRCMRPHTDRIMAADNQPVNEWLRPSLQARRLYAWLFDLAKKKKNPKTMDGSQHLLDFFFKRGRRKKKKEITIDVFGCCCCCLRCRTIPPAGGSIGVDVITSTPGTKTRVVFFLPTVTQQGSSALFHIDYIWCQSAGV